MRDNRLDEALQGLGVQEPEHEMCYPYGMKALQLADHFCTASRYEVLLWAVYHLSGVLRDTGRTQVGQFDLRRVSAHTSAVAFQHGKLVRVFFNCA